jgi:AraC-like DNA-binding protein
MLPYYEIHAKNLRMYRRTRQLSFPAHMHRSIEILYVFSGVQGVEIDGIAHTVHEGEGIIIFPDILHRYIRLEDHPVDAVLIIFDPQRLFGGLFPDLQNVQPCTPFISKERIHEEAVYALRQISLEDEFTVQLGRLYLIWSHLIRHSELQPRKRMPVSDMPVRIMEYLTGHFREPVTLDSLAAEFCVSKYYISHIFSNRIKMNFRQYLGLLRAQYAARLLLTSDTALAAVSSYAGFDSQRTFNRVFRAHYGMSPKEFRKREKVPGR